ncbi:hypothetical protein PR048_000431 [Dryococelus australis]|uniref:Uncharacterized protein n=1 Tax=Dryococelus australis TaxID=614101 RepID=A0ABQ9IEM2_9NEOP|nr:hypothetical protein PR048_000431 [Dryococelus australis]
MAQYTPTLSPMVTAACIKIFRMLELKNCRNHLLRNYCSKLSAAVGTAGKSCLNYFLRKTLEENIGRLRTAVNKAMQFVKKQDKPNNVEELRKDLFNGHYDVDDVFIEQRPAGRSKVLAGARSSHPVRGRGARTVERSNKVGVGFVRGVLRKEGGGKDFLLRCYLASLLRNTCAMVRRFRGNSTHSSDSTVPSRLVMDLIAAFAAVLFSSLPPPPTRGGPCYHLVRHPFLQRPPPPPPNSFTSHTNRLVNLPLAILPNSVVSGTAFVPICEQLSSVNGRQKVYFGKALENNLSSLRVFFFLDKGYIYVGITKRVEIFHQLNELIEEDVPEVKELTSAQKMVQAHRVIHDETMAMKWYIDGLLLGPFVFTTPEPDMGRVWHGIGATSGPAMVSGAYQLLLCTVSERAPNPVRRVSGVVTLLQRHGESAATRKRKVG